MARGDLVPYTSSMKNTRRDDTTTSAEETIAAARAELAATRAEYKRLSAILRERRARATRCPLGSDHPDFDAISRAAVEDASAQRR